MLLAEQKFWKYVKKTKGCWKWSGAKDSFGYGHVTIGYPKRTTKKAHRVSYEIHVGKIPRGRLVCHSCDIPSCTNPKHLWLGSIQDNMKDRNIKGRQTHKLTMEQAKEIRKMYKPYKMSRRHIGELFGVSGGSIQQILRGDTYKI